MIMVILSTHHLAIFISPIINLYQLVPLLNASSGQRSAQASTSGSPSCSRMALWWHTTPSWSWSRWTVARLGEATCGGFFWVGDGCTSGGWFHDEFFKGNMTHVIVCWVVSRFFLFSTIPADDRFELTCVILRIFLGQLTANKCDNYPEYHGSPVVY